MNDIKIIRGDTSRFEVEVLDQTGEKYNLQEEDELVFTVKKNTSTDITILQKQILGDTFTLTHEDTKSLDYGKYVYDIQLTQANGDVTTVIQPSIFEIMPEVNFD